MPIIRSRPFSLSDLPQGLHPVLARVYAARGVQVEQNLQLAQLEPYQAMKGIREAVDALVPVVTQVKSLLVVGDFDVDGATSTALVIRALRMMGALNVDYLVPNRFDFGYGLSPELVEHALQSASQVPDLIITVDNGISSVEGVAKAKRAGVPVIVTDHHLPGSQLPDAQAILNPNQAGCGFSSKAACGCTVAFYLMLALRAELVNQAWFNGAPPNLANLLDLVALATVADLVPLDQNNRILVEQGLRRIRAGKAQPGVLALLQQAGKDFRKTVPSDFGFGIGPRLNAAGRLDDMSLGIECLLTDNMAQAQVYAQELTSLNQERRQIEESMKQEALSLLDQLPEYGGQYSGICLFHPEWHQGVIGILASRIKEREHRPVVVFAQDDSGCLKGSARSIAGFHIRDALDLLDKRCPGLLIKFGGHAMAAGMSIQADQFARFNQEFIALCDELLDEDSLQQVIETDGELKPSEFSLELAELLRWSGPWGQGFPEPLFEGVFTLVQQRIVGERHLKLVLQPEQSNQMLDAICFNVDLDQWPNTHAKQLSCVYQLDVNEFRGQQSVQLMIRHIALA